VNGMSENGTKTLLHGGLVDREHLNQLARESYHKNKHKQKETRKIYNRERKQKLKLKAIEYKGGCCQDCGGVFHPAVYDFHHLDPTIKDYNPSASLDRNWDRAKEELDKCILLCANCHRKLHFNLKDCN